MSEEGGRPAVSVSWTALQTINHDLLRRPQIEACGVMLGDYGKDEAINWWRVEEAIPLVNISSSPTYFEFDPAELLALEMQYPGRIVGVYHSHPTGFARASGTDRQNMQRINVEQHIPWCWLIIHGPFDSAFEQQVELHSAMDERMIAYHYYPEQGVVTYQGLTQLAIHLLGYRR